MTNALPRENVSRLSVPALPHPDSCAAMRTIVECLRMPPSPWAQHDKPTPARQEQPLGNIKMPIGASLMLHGTNKPQSIGTAASHGCIRLFTQDAWELARWLQSHSTAPHSDALFKEYESNRQRSFSVQQVHYSVDLVYDYVEIRADQPTSTTMSMRALAINGRTSCRPWRHTAMPRTALIKRHYRSGSKTPSFVM